MGGIVGYYGSKNAETIVLHGLANLAYKGYDIAGMAVVTEEGKIASVKRRGAIREEEAFLGNERIAGIIGIGNTRWANDLEQQEVEAVTFLNEARTFAVVVSGTVENTLDLHDKMLEAGHVFLTESDPEIIVHLIESYYTGDFREAVQKALGDLEGDYAIAAISSYHSSELVAAKKDSPLVVGYDDDGYYITSDVAAICDYTHKVYYMDKDELVYMQDGDITLYNIEGKPLDRQVSFVEWDDDSTSKKGYQHFMLKEIYEQPQALRDTMAMHLVAGGQRVIIDETVAPEQRLKAITRIYIVGCGTSYHAGLIGKYILERLTRVPVQVEIASEFRYNEPILDHDTLLIAISQSGETADTLAAMRYAQAMHIPTIAITNMVESSLAREADYTCYTEASVEVAYISTKSYTAQIVALYMIAFHVAKGRKTLTDSQYDEMIGKLKAIPDQMDQLLKDPKGIQRLAKWLATYDRAFYIGRGVDYITSMEAALKLKEVSYIYSEAFAAGELKHGTIAVIDKTTPVLVIATQDKLVDKMLTNIQEVKKRGATVLALAKESNKQIGKVVEHVFYIPDVDDLLTPLLAAIPTQLVAYYAAIEKGNDADRPRYLKKSVLTD